MFSRQSQFKARKSSEYARLCPYHLVCASCPAFFNFLHLNLPASAHATSTQHREYTYFALSLHLSIVPTPQTEIPLGYHILFFTIGISHQAELASLVSITVNAATWITEYACITHSSLLIANLEPCPILLATSCNSSSWTRCGHPKSHHVAAQHHHFRAQGLRRSQDPRICDPLAHLGRGRSHF